MPVRDFLQGASNAAADTVAGPVDLISWALRGVGVPVGPSPVGGSAWMRERGLTAPARGAGGLLGEAAGLSAPIVAAAKAPQIARGLLALDDAAMEQARKAVEGQMVRMGGIQPATVWHGSPHRFNKFDSAHIGKGEGAQAYGHGLYLADARKTAESYTALGRPKGIQTWQEADGTWTALLERANGDSKTFTGFANSAQAMNAADAFAKDGAKNLYKVDLPDGMIARMLDWDKPLSQQAPEVQAAIAKLPKGYVTGTMGERRFMDPSALHRTGEGLLQDLQMLRRGAPEALLQQQGIPGIRYLDGNSRGAGAGTSNYVVFPGEEGALTILERNGGLLASEPVVKAAQPYAVSSARVRHDPRSFGGYATSEEMLAARAADEAHSARMGDAWRRALKKPK